MSATAGVLIAAVLLVVAACVESRAHVLRRRELVDVREADEFVAELRTSDVDDAAAARRAQRGQDLASWYDSGLFAPDDVAFVMGLGERLGLQPPGPQS